MTPRFLAGATGAVYRENWKELVWGLKNKSLVVCVEFVMLTRYPGIGS